jgi:hypothetical protein
MKKLLFAAVITMIVVSSALAGGIGAGGSGMSIEDRCKGCPSWRSPASSDMPPVMGRYSGAYPYGPLNFVSPYPGPGERADALPLRKKRDVHKR